MLRNCAGMGRAGNRAPIKRERDDPFEDPPQRTLSGTSGGALALFSSEIAAEGRPRNRGRRNPPCRMSRTNARYVLRIATGAVVVLFAFIYFYFFAA